MPATGNGKFEMTLFNINLVIRYEKDLEVETGPANKGARNC